jgi:hypothetical protein
MVSNNCGGENSGTLLERMDKEKQRPQENVRIAKFCFKKSVPITKQIVFANVAEARITKVYATRLCFVKF